MLPNEGHIIISPIDSTKVGSVQQSSLQFTRLDAIQ